MRITQAIFCAALFFGASSAALAENWSGFYMGPQVAYTWSSTSWQAQNGATITHFYPEGVTVGPHAGWVFPVDAWVLGVEGTYSGGSYSSQIGYSDALSLKTTVRQLFTVAPVVGYTQQSWLFYGKAGYASGKVEADAYSSTSNIASDSQRQSGWTAGLGTAYRISQKKSIGLEYNYTRLGSTNFNSDSNAVTVNPININTLGLNYTHYFG